MKIITFIYLLIVCSCTNLNRQNIFNKNEICVEILNIKKINSWYQRKERIEIVNDSIGIYFAAIGIEKGTNVEEVSKNAEIRAEFNLSFKILVYVISKRKTNNNTYEDLMEMYSNINIKNNLFTDYDSLRISDTVYVCCLAKKNKDDYWNEISMIKRKY